MPILSEEQWALLQPILPQTPKAVRGRPALDNRSILEGILWKHLHQAPWYNLPSGYPSYQTCYRRYLLWQRTGVLDNIYRLLYKDLRDRGGLEISSLLEADRIQFSRRGSRWIFTLPPDLEGTWQASAALLLLNYFLKQAKQKIKERSIKP